MADKIIITKDITTVPASSLVNGKVIGVNPLNKLSQTTYTEPIPLSQKGAINGVATLDENGNVVQKSNLNIEVQPIGLNSPAPTKDGVFMPFEVGVYQNYGNLELTQNEKNSNIVYFYRLNGQFSKVVKSIDIIGKVSKSGDTMTDRISMGAEWIYTNNIHRDFRGSGNGSFVRGIINVISENNQMQLAVYVDNQEVRNLYIANADLSSVGIEFLKEGRIICKNATEPNHAMTFGQFSGELNNVYDQISARANNRLSNLASDLSESEKQAIKQKLGIL